VRIPLRQRLGLARENAQKTLEELAELAGASGTALLRIAAKKSGALVGSGKKMLVRNLKQVSLGRKLLAMSRNGGCGNSGDAMEFPEPIRSREKETEILKRQRLETIRAARASQMQESPVLLASQQGKNV